MASAARLLATAVTALLAAAVAAPAHAADLRPGTVTGPTIRQGADGAEHTLMCPPDEMVLGGGFTVSAPRGRKLEDRPSDLLSSRPTADADGWIVAVGKSLKPISDRVHGHTPADLTLVIVCTEGEVSPGA